MNLHMIGSLLQALKRFILLHNYFNCQLLFILLVFMPVATLCFGVSMPYFQIKNEFKHLVE